MSPITVGRLREALAFLDANLPVAVRACGEEHDLKDATMVHTLTTDWLNSDKPDVVQRKVLVIE